MQDLAVSDVFVDSWDSLREEKGGNKIIKVMRYLQVMRVAWEKQELMQYGYYVRIVLKILAKKGMKPILKRLDPEQLVDIFNDIQMLKSPWFFFPNPVIKCEGTLFMAPDERLSNIDYNNWKFADAKFTKYLIHKNNGEVTEARQELDKLIACLYVPEAPSRDFLESSIEAHARLLDEQMKEWEKLLACETFGHIRTSIVKREKALFPKVKGKTNDDSEVNYTGEMWKDLHYDLADTEAFKGYEAAGKANIYHALDYLNKKAKEAKITS